MLRSPSGCLRFFWGLRLWVFEAFESSWRAFGNFSTSLGFTFMTKPPGLFLEAFQAGNSGYFRLTGRASMGSAWADIYMKHGLHALSP